MTDSQPNDNSLVIFVVVVSVVVVDALLDEVASAAAWAHSFSTQLAHDCS